MITQRGKSISLRMLANKQADSHLLRLFISNKYPTYQGDFQNCLIQIFILKLDKPYNCLISLKMQANRQTNRQILKLFQIISTQYNDLLPNIYNKKLQKDISSTTDSINKLLS